MGDDLHSLFEHVRVAIRACSQNTGSISAGRRQEQMLCWTAGALGAPPGAGKRSMSSRNSASLPLGNLKPPHTLAQLALARTPPLPMSPSGRAFTTPLPRGSPAPPRPMSSPRPSSASSRASPPGPPRRTPPSPTECFSRSPRSAPRHQCGPLPYFARHPSWHRGWGWVGHSRPCACLSTLQEGAKTAAAWMPCLSLLQRGQQQASNRYE